MSRIRSYNAQRLVWGACAIVAGGDVLFGLSRLFGVFAEGLFGRIRVFRERNAAVQWLAGELIPGLITGD